MKSLYFYNFGKMYQNYTCVILFYINFFLLLSKVLCYWRVTVILFFIDKNVNLCYIVIKFYTLRMIYVSRKCTAGSSSANKQYL